MTEYRHPTSSEVEAALTEKAPGSGKLYHLSHLLRTAATEREEEMVIELAREASKHNDRLARAVARQQSESRAGNVFVLHSLKRFREAHGMDQKALGETIGASGVLISRYENGEPASARMSRRLARVFNTFVAELRERPEGGSG